MNIRARMAEKTANLRSAMDIQADEVRRSQTPKTGPGMAAALAAANMRIQALEARGTQLILPVSSIFSNPWQPRRVFNEAKLAELAESVREVGLIQPIVVRRAESAYQIIAGERRWRVHQMLGLEDIKAINVECTDQDMAVLALVENIGREDLSDYEIGVAIRRTENEFPNRKRLAEAMGLSRAGLYQFLAFENLPPFIKESLSIQPRLLGGTAAQAIVATIKKYGEDGVKAAMEIWPLIVKGDMDQGKAAPAIAALATRQSTPAATRERSIDKFFAGKEHAGSIIKDISNFTVKIKAGVLTEAQETQIRQLISQMFHSQPQLS